MQQHFVTFIAVQRLHARVGAQKDEAVGAFLDSLIQECDCPVVVRQGQISRRGFVRAGIRAGARRFFQQRYHFVFLPRAAIGLSEHDHRDR